MESTDTIDNDPFGAVTGGTYRFLMPIAEGGMGRVDVVVRRDGGFRRLYALKRLHAQYRNEAAFRAMFLDEARIAGLLRHPNTVSVLDVGEDEHGPFLVMDYVDGVPLSAILKRIQRTGEVFPMQLVVAVVAQAARGLHAAHELMNHDGTSLGLVHRDVSPQNILVSFNGAVQMTDFGVAKAMGRLTKTQSGVLKGKFGYMSPEQLRFHELDRRSDLFSLGVVLFELSAGRRLYKNNEEVPAPRRILEDPPPDLGEERDGLLPGLVELCFELLAKDPAGRPTSAKDVADRLEEIGRELAYEEGRLELSDYMNDAFGEVRATTRDRIEATISELALAPAIGHQPAPFPATRPATSPATHPATHPAAKSRRALILAAAAVLSLGGLGLAYWSSIGPEPTESTESAAEAEAQAEVQEAEEQTPASALPPVAPTPVEIPTEQPPEAPAADRAEEPPARMASMRRRRRTRATMMNEASMRAVWMWPDNQ
ncbi:MAG: serine/threonine protein kinase [Polyangiales bacterium]